MSNKMVIERNLLESVLFEDDSKGKQIAEKMKKYAKGIVDKITELGNVLKKKILEKVNNLKPTDNDIKISKANARKIEKLEKEMDALRLVGKNLEDSISMVTYLNKNYRNKWGVENEGSNESLREFKEKLKIVEEKQGEVKRRIDKLNGDESKISDSDKELIVLKKSKAGSLFNNYKNLVKSEASGIIKALKEVKALASVISNLEAVKVLKGEKKRVNIDVVIVKTAAITLRSVAFSLGRIIRATGVLISIGVARLFNKNNGDEK